MVRAVTPIPFVKARFFDRCGKPLAGGKVYTYEANTTTDKTTYKDPYGLTPNTNPIILDAAGEADIYLDGTYRIRITDRNDVLINDVAKIGSWFSDNLQDTLDNISGAMDDAIKPALQSLDDAINTAAAAGAGINGWTDLLISTQNGRNQRDRNSDFKTLRDYLTNSEITDTKNTVSTTDIADKLQAAFNDTSVSKIYIPDGNYYINKALTCNRDIEIEASPKAIFNFGVSGMISFTGSAELIGKPTADITSLSKEIKLASADTLVKPFDLLCIYNPTDYSFSPHRAYYRSGEFIRAATVTSDTVSTFGNLIDSYTATSVDIYKIKPIRVRLYNFRVSASPSATKSPITITFGQDLVIDNYENINSNIAGITLDRCFNFDINSGIATNLSQLNGLNYGIAISNCQNFRVTGGNHNAARHCIALGGGSGICSVPTREGKISNAVLKSASEGLGSADMHGNCEFITYQNCIISHAHMAGKNVKYDTCTIYGRVDPSITDGSCIWGDEPLGGDFDIIDCTLETNGDGAAFGYIYLATKKPLLADLNINIKNLRIKGSGGGANSKLVQFLSTVAQTKKVNVSIDGVISTLTDLAYCAFIMRSDDTTQALPSDYIVVDNITNTNTSVVCSFIYANATALAAKTRQMRQSGSVVVTSVANAKSVVAALTNFKYAYSKIPTIQMSMSAVGSTAMTENYLNAVGATDPLIVVTPYNAAISNKSCRPGLLSSKALPADKQFLLSWTAEINEV